MGTLFALVLTVATIRGEYQDVRVRKPFAV